MHHPKTDVDRLYLPRVSDGKVLIQIKATYKTATIGLEAYMNVNMYKLLDVIGTHDKVRITKIITT